MHAARDEPAPPAAAAPAGDRRRDSPLPRTLAQRRVLFDLPAMPLDAAVERLLATEFADAPARLAALREVLLRPRGATTLELVPGVAFASARADAAEAPLVFLGISPEGVDVPGASEPAHLVFLQVSPLDAPEAHLENLSAVAEAVADLEAVRSLARCRSLDDLHRWFLREREP